MKGLLVTLFSLMLVVLPATAQLHEVTNAEYFWNADPGSGNGTPLSVVADDTVALGTDVSTTGLTPGVHVLNVRVQRDDGAWGDVTRRRVRVGVGTTFEAAEVFWDTDPGVGQGTSVAIAEGGVINDTAFAVPPLARGFHKLHLRSLSNATWSPPTARVVRVGSAWIDGAEVYFDTDPGEGLGIPVDVGTGTDVTAYDTTVSVLAGGPGIHNVHLRFRGGGVWSFPKIQTLRIGPWVDGGISRIAGGEFFFDTDPGEGNGCPFFAEDGAFDEGEEFLRRYPLGSDAGLGQHVVYARVMDAGGRWQNVVRDTVQIIESHLVTSVRSDGLGRHVRVMWTPYPEATEYHVHYDSTVTGPFTDYVTVAAPDTVVEFTPDPWRRFYRVVAVQPDPEPCAGRSSNEIMNN